MFRKTGTAPTSVKPQEYTRSRRDLRRLAAVLGVVAAVAAVAPQACAASNMPKGTMAAKLKTKLPRTPEEFFPAMKERFDTLDVDTVMQMFEKDAVFVDGTATVHHGKEAIAKELKKYFDTGLKMDLTPGHVFTSGDTTISINDWSYDGADKSGKSVRMSGSTSDVLHRGKDGVWRYVIDNPYGTKVGR